MEGKKVESLAQKLFAALSKNKGAYLNDYEVARMSGLHESQLDAAKEILEEVLSGSDMHISVTTGKDRRWKMTSKRPVPKAEKEEKQISLF